MNNKEYRQFDINRIKNKQSKIVSSEEALKDVTPIKWSEDVLLGKRKITVGEMLTQ